MTTTAHMNPVGGGPPDDVRPQPGPQERFASCRADVAFYGGAAGGGKTFSLLLEPLYHVADPDFGAVVFRRTYPEIVNQGGIWDTSLRLYPRCGAVPKVGDLTWTFDSGARVTFAHLQHEADVLKWHSSQIPLIEFDELTTFGEYQFTYLLSRNRSTCSVRPYIRAGCNPDAASWVARWVEWYIDPTTGYPVPDRAGKLRWFVRDGDNLRWSSDPAALRRDYPESGDPLSFTFVPAALDDNKILTATDPRYRSALMALPRVERERLLKGNWLVSSAEGEWPPDYFGRHLYFADWPAAAERSACVIAWDPSKGSDARYGDYSALVVLVRDNAGKLYADAVGSQRWPVEEGIDQALDLCDLYDPDCLVIEANQFQSLIKPMLLARCRELGRVPPPLSTIDNRKNKEVRIRRLGHYLCNRLIRLKGDSTGARVMAEQAMVFPNGEHDDHIDAAEMSIRTMGHVLKGKAKSPRQPPRQPGRR